MAGSTAKSRASSVAWAAGRLADIQREMAEIFRAFPDLRPFGHGYSPSLLMRVGRRRHPEVRNTPIANRTIH